MKRTGFKPKVPLREGTQCTYVPRPRAAVVAIHDGKDRMVVTIPKRQPLRDESYRRWVASLHCARCGKAGPSQAAHADEHKGMSLKSSDESCYPLCADSPGRRGCHVIIGATGTLPREHRRRLEQQYAAQTRLQFESDGACQR